MTKTIKRKMICPSRVVGEATRREISTIMDVFEAVPRSRKGDSAEAIVTGGSLQGGKHRPKRGGVKCKSRD